MPVVQNAGLGLRDVPARRGDHRRPQPLAVEHRRIVEIHERGTVIQLEVGQRQRQPAAAQQRRQEPLAAEPGELFDDRRERRDRQVEAAEVVGIVVAPLALPGFCGRGTCSDERRITRMKRLSA